MIKLVEDFTYNEKRIINDKLFDYVAFFQNLIDEEESLYGYSELYLEIFPKLVFKEETEKFKAVFSKLIDYIEDDFIHELSPIYQYALYHTINYISTLQDQEPYYKSIFEFPNNTKLGKEWELNDFADASRLLIICFEDLDVLSFPAIFQKYKEDFKDYRSNTGMYMNFDKYFDLMPQDIKEEWKVIKNSTLNCGLCDKNLHEYSSIEPPTITTIIERILDKFEHSIINKSGYKLLWNDDGTPRKEETIQILLERLIFDDCKANNIDVSREVETGRGTIDFKLSTGYKERVLLEVKLGTNTKLVHGLEKQLIQYMKSEEIDEAFFLVVIFDYSVMDKIEKLKQKIRQIEKDENRHIKIKVIDATKSKRSASNLK